METELESGPCVLPQPVPWHLHVGAVWYQGEYVASADIARTQWLRAQRPAYECYGVRQAKLFLRAETILEQAFEEVWDDGGTEALKTGEPRGCHVENWCIGAQVTLQKRLDAWAKDNPTPLWVWDDDVVIDLAAEDPANTATTTDAVASLLKTNNPLLVILREREAFLAKELAALRKRLDHEIQEREDGPENTRAVALLEGQRHELWQVIAVVRERLRVEQETSQNLYKSAKVLGDKLESYGAAQRQELLRELLGTLDGPAT